MYLPLAAALVAPVPPAPNPDWVARVVLAHKAGAIDAAGARGTTPDERAALRAKAERETRHWFYLSWHAVPPDKLPRFQRVARWWFNNLHFAADCVEFREVAGSGGLVWWFDRREPDWPPDAVSAVFRRDPVFRQPAVGEQAAAALRASVGRKPDPATAHVEAVAWAPRVFRDTVESQRAASYYDLLFGRQRFGGYAEHHDPKHAGWYTADGGRSWVEKAKLPKPDPDFPRSAEDFEALFRVAGKGSATAGGRKVDVVWGAVCAGYQEDEKNGSLVGRGPRVVLVEQGLWGPKMETLDAKEGVGGKNFVEFAGSGKLVRGEKPPADASEYLNALPAGGQACLLAGGDERRVEIADGNIARGPAPLNKACKFVAHPQVRNPGDCVRCHAPSYGLIPPRNVVADFEAAGVPVRYYDPADAVRHRGFFGQLQRRVPGYQEPYKALVEKATAAPGEKPWTGRQLVEAFEEFWSWYDQPVTQAQAAAELGVPVAVLNRLADRPLAGQPKALVRGLACPRPSFDADVRPALLDVLVTNHPKEVHYEWPLAP